MVPKNFNPSYKHPLYFIRKGLYRKISLYAPQLKGKLLDFGCGEKPYQSLFTNVDEYIGLDYDGEGHDHQNEAVDVYYDGKTIPFENESFDSVFTSEVFEHVFGLQEILPEINRVMKPGSQILLTCPFAWEEHEMPYDFARYTTPALQFLYEKNGFQVIDNFKTGNYIEVIFQFSLNYIKNILPNNKYVRQVILFPFIVFINFFGTIFSFILPKDKTAYFNNVFVIEKVENIY